MLINSAAACLETRKRILKKLKYWMKKFDSRGVKKTKSDNVIKGKLSLISITK